MTTTTQTAVTTQVYRVYIRATPQAIWDAITKPEWSERYGYGGRVEYDLRPGGRYRACASEAIRLMPPSRGAHSRSLRHLLGARADCAR